MSDTPAGNITVTATKREDDASKLRDHPAITALDGPDENRRTEGIRQ